MGEDERAGEEHSSAGQSWLNRYIPLGPVIALLVALPVSSNLLLWRFLNFAPWWLYLFGAGAALALLYGIIRAVNALDLRGPTVAQVLISAAVALAVMALGGEGRLFYENYDWQVRDAVLRDMVLNPWPFSYALDGQAQVLRAPIGMYLLPALAGKLWGLGAMHPALLLQNSAFLAGILSAGATLFATRRARAIALFVVVFFSGMDVLGRLTMELAGAVPDPVGAGYHIENWIVLQFSSHITQAFWVPQHGLAGWLGALLFLLWRADRVPLWIFLTAIPLALIWSPLSIFGAIPLAAYAGLRSIHKRSLRPRSIIIPAVATGFSVPVLLYLGAGGDAVGLRLFPVSLAAYFRFQLFETLPYLVGAVLLRNRRGSAAILLLTGIWLLFVPFVQIGTSVDFMMRASIPALAILAVLVADALVLKDPLSGGQRFTRYMLIVTLLLGAVTPALEIGRALMLRPSPRTECTLVEAATRVEGLAPTGSLATYAAPRESFPEVIRPSGTRPIPERAQPLCWSRPWQVRR